MPRMRRWGSFRFVWVSVFFVLGCEAAPPDGMVLVPAGDFWMGTNERGLEEMAEEFGISKPWVLDAAPKRRLNLPAFFIDRFEVSAGDYSRFIAATGFPVPPHWVGVRPAPGQEGLPVTYVNWEEARAYCAWVGKRLPSEAEWEKAARGSDGWNYPWGFFFDPRRANVGGLGPGLAPVGSYPLGKSPYGVYNMIGNV